MRAINFPSLLPGVDGTSARVRTLRNPGLCLKFQRSQNGSGLIFGWSVLQGIAGLGTGYTGIAIRNRMVGDTHI